VRAGNRAQWGGALFVSGSLLSLSPQSSSAFDLNHAVFGGAVYSDSTDIAVAGKCYFLENSALYGGGIQAVLRTRISIKSGGYAEFRRNFCDHSGGGAILRSDSSWVNEGRVVFLGQCARRIRPLCCREGALTGRSSGNFAGKSGGCLSVWDASLTAQAKSSSEYRGNTAVIGGCMELVHAVVVFDGGSTFDGNTADYGGAVSLSEGCTARFKGNITFNGESSPGSRGDCQSRPFSRCDDALSRQATGPCKAAESTPSIRSLSRIPNQA
jgi:hypothetical protein